MTIDYYVRHYNEKLCMYARKLYAKTSLLYIEFVFAYTSYIIQYSECLFLLTFPMATHTKNLVKKKL